MGSLPSARVKEWRVPALVGLVELSRLIMLAMVPDKWMAVYLPDDAFYYLVLGKNFAATGKWTFDGVEPASGFHVLWGYLMAALYWVAPHITLHGVILVAGTFSVVCAVLATWLMVKTATRIFGADADVGVALICLSSLALLVDLFLMEAAVAILASALLVNLLCRTEAVLSRRAVAVAFLLGVAGVAARSEFGLLSLCLFAMQVVLWRRRVSGVAMVWLAGAALIGSVAGELGLALHTHWISGHWVQASAEEKLLWSRNMGFSMAMVGYLLGDFFDASYNVTMNDRHMALLALWKWVPIALLLLGLAVAWARRSNAARRGMIVGLGCSVGAFALLYRFNNSGIQPWYISVVEAPVAVLVAGGLSFYLSRWRVATLMFAAALCCWGIVNSYRGQFFWQRPLWNAGMYVKAHPEVRPIGAWNSGIIAYFAGGEVTNLDGLVNDSILPYAKSGTLLDYVERRRLRSIIDYGMWFAPFIAKNGGYANGDLERCLESADVLKGDDLGEWDTVQLFVVKPECGGQGIAPR